MMTTQPTTPQKVTFTCRGTATGKMRNELDVRMTSPMEEHFTLATDEGPFHGGDATAPPPLALFVGGLTGCIMTQIRAFAKRLKIEIRDLSIDARVTWDWTPTGRTYETAPRSFEIDVMLDSPASLDAQKDLIAAARKGCFIEQTLGQGNTIRHRLRHGDDWIDAN